MWQGLLTSFYIAVVSIAVCEGRGWHRYNYPNPRNDPAACGQSRTSYVCDPDGLLEDYEAEQLDREIMSLMEDTQCPCSVYACNQGTKGYKVGVALVGELTTDKEAKGNSRDEEHNDVEAMLDESMKFSYTVLQQWNLGECEEDLIIFYSAKDHVLYTFTGDVTKKKLENHFVGEIAMTHRKQFQDGRYFDGLKSLISEYKNVFLDKYDRKTSEPAGPKYAAVYSSDSKLLPCLATSLLMALVTYLLH